MDARTDLEKLFKKSFDDRTYRLLSSLLLGRRQLLGEQRKYFAAAGTMHLLAISGLHIATLSAGIFFILGLFGLPYRWRLTASLIVIMFYCLLCGATASVLRAGLMCTALTTSFFLRRKGHAVNHLALAGILTLLIAPDQVFTIGFQLSYMAVLSLLIFARIIGPFIDNHGGFDPVTRAIVTSLWVSIFTAPLTSLYFSKIYINIIFYNLILIPMLNMILLLALAFIVLAVVAPAAAALAALLELLSSLFLALNRYFAAMPGAALDFTCSIPLAVGCYVILAVAVISFQRYNKTYAAAQSTLSFYGFVAGACLSLGRRVFLCRAKRCSR